MAKSTGLFQWISYPRASTAPAPKSASPFDRLRAWAFGSSSAGASFAQRRARQWRQFLTTLETHYDTAYLLRRDIGILRALWRMDAAVILQLDPIECAHAVSLLHEAERLHAEIAVTLSQLSLELFDRSEVSYEKLLPKWQRRHECVAPKSTPRSSNS
jgi:hypothetical protein